MSWEENVRKVVPYTPGEQPKNKNVIKQKIGWQAYLHLTSGCQTPRGETPNLRLTYSQPKDRHIVVTHSMSAKASLAGTYLLCRP